MKFREPLSIRLPDPDAERVRRNHDERISELAKRPAASLHVISNVALVDGIATTIPHGLERLPVWVKASDVRTPASSGRIEEVRDSGHDRTRVIVLKATGFGATVTVDVAVM